MNAGKRSVAWTTPTLFGAVVLSCVGARAADSVDYATQIKPLLAQRCVTCHGPLKQEGGLRVDAAALIKAGGDTGPGFLAGDPAKSLLIDVVAGRNGYEGENRMPREAAPLTADEIALLSKWIAQGAPAPSDEKVAARPEDHWAFQVPRRPEIPQPKDAAWVRTPLDAFLAVEREKRGLRPAPEASKNVLLRRLSLDLIGLPPTEKELAEFLADDSPDAYRNAVDRLLSSPQYGERWGRHWMDVWRYSDWYGYGNELRNSSRHIWRWRDWIVDSLNEDKPYDRMVMEMLAADELDPGNSKSLRATGFLTRQYFKFNRNIWLENTVEHTSKAFLGVTMNCARCHDHKYDPISQDAFYEFRAIFEPYQVRTDRVSEAAVEKVGLDLAYDAALKTETFVFDRGNEATPLKDRAMQPTVPAVLGKTPFVVAPVDLPASQWYPALRAELQQALRDEAQARLKNLPDAMKKANADLIAARNALESVRQRIGSTIAVAEIPADAGHPTELAPGETNTEPFLVDNFAASNDRLWKRGPGEWEYAGRKLLQKNPAAAFHALHSVSAHPRDVSIEFRYRTLSGGPYKSVGVSFDHAEGDSDSIYSSVGSGKISMIATRGDKPSYPPEGVKPYPFALGKEYTLRLDLRDRLLNVSINGELQFAIRLSERREGTLSLWTYDATAEFLSIRVTPLPTSAKLAEPTTPGSNAAPAPSGTPLTLADAEANVREAEIGVRLSEKRAELEKTAAQSALARIDADNARHTTPNAPTADALAKAAVQLQRDEALLTAEAAEVQAELDEAKAQRAAALDPAKSKAAEEAKAKRAAAQKAIETAKAEMQKPLDGNYTPLGPVYPKQSTGRRLALAKWIVGKENPLAARVAVNHLWLRHFGQPLVPTMFDFGLNGKPPSHPELLDWLACELRDGPETASPGENAAWRMKHVHRLMVMSAAYRMDSAGSADPGDPDNRLYSRMNSRRLEAEIVRDSLLSIAGNLDAAQGGPELDENLGLTTFRRSLYYRHAPEKFMTFLEVFDSANTTECYRRIETVVPQQALALVNSQLAIEQSRRFAAKLSADFGGDDLFVDKAFGRILCRRPADSERAACLAFLKQQAERLADPKQLTAFNTGAALNVKASADPKQRARENLVHVLFNHTEFVTIR